MITSCRLPKGAVLTTTKFGLDLAIISNGGRFRNENDDKFGDTIGQSIFPFKFYSQRHFSELAWISRRIGSV
jgi:hypothetical protein